MLASFAHMAPAVDAKARYYLSTKYPAKIGQVTYKCKQNTNDYLEHILKPSKFQRQKMNSMSNLSHLSPNRSLRNYFETNTQLIKSRIYKKGDQYIPSID